MLSPTRLAGVGAFVLGGTLLFAVGLFMIGDRQMMFADKFVIYTEFTRITGLQPGAIVRVSGAKAGSVTEIVPPSNPNGKFRVRLEITEDLHQLVRRDSVASIQTEGLIGGSFLSVSTGSSASPQSPAESTIQGREPFELADLLQQMTDTIVNVNHAIDEVQAGLEEATGSLIETSGAAKVVIVEVSADVKVMAGAGARLSADAAQISEGIRQGQGTIGKLVKDDELYRRATAVAARAETISADTEKVIQQARRMLEKLESKDGQVADVTATLKQTLDSASVAMTGFAENMTALKRSFFFRGFFNRRGFFDLSEISPAEYREGALTNNGDRRPTRIWLRESELFGGPGGKPDMLTDTGKAKLDLVLTPYLERIADGVLIVEGYAREGSPADRYVVSRTRAAIVREYLIAKFHLNPQATGTMPLSADTSGSPDGSTWSGVALAVFLD